MKIFNLNNNYIKTKKTNSNHQNRNNFSNVFYLNKDTVNFTGQSYSLDSIAYRTNHCAYCGSKVYSEEQLEAFAKEMLTGKSNRLRDRIKSILEKLNSAVNSEELTFAKKNENREEIEFFEKFLKGATEKSHLRGEEILEELYGLEQKEAFDILKKKLRPLTATVDHISPQNLDEENKNSDINLVEACYCCNHDLKKGMPFQEFYAMYPTIRENMPPDKFQYAQAKLLSKSAASIENRMSATNLLRHVQNLLGQRKDTIDKLNNINYRITEAKSSIDESISTCEDEIESKRAKIKQLQEELAIMSEDEEYCILLTRKNLLQQKAQLDQIIRNLTNRRDELSSQINSLSSKTKKQNKNQSPEDIQHNQEKIAELKKDLLSLEETILETELNKEEIEKKIIDLDKKLPRIETLKTRQIQLNEILSQMRQLTSEKITLGQLKEELKKLDDKIQEIEEKLKQLPTNDFDLRNYSEKEQNEYLRYQELSEAMNYINAHLSDKNVKAVISSMAKAQVEEELRVLSQNRIIKDSIDIKTKKELESELSSVNKEREKIKQAISKSEKVIRNLKAKIQNNTPQECQNLSNQVEEQIKRLKEKMEYLSYPSEIETLEGEITLLNNTIIDLEKQKKEILNLSLIG